MPVRALEIRTGNFELRRYVPAAATLICNKRELESVRDLLYEGGVIMYGSEAIGDGEGRAFQRNESLGEVMRRS